MQVVKGFYVIEGIDGAGSTTQLELIARDGSAKGIVATAEPTSGHIGKLVRRVLKGELTLHAKALASLFSADRAEHLYGKGGILSLLASSHKVVSDRYLFSSLSYQSVECGMEYTSTINSLFPLPQAVFYLYVPIAKLELILERIDSRGKAKEIYEKRPFLEKVIVGYDDIFRAYSAKGLKVVTIDATLDRESIHKKIMQYILA